MLIAFSVVSAFAQPVFANPAGSSIFRYGRLLLDGADTCGGVVLKGSLVMTAAHCVQAPETTIPYAKTRLSFMVYDPIDRVRRLFSVRAIAMVPGFQYASDQDPPAEIMQDDIAIIRINGLADKNLPPAYLNKPRQTGAGQGGRPFEGTLYTLANGSVHQLANTTLEACPRIKFDDALIGAACARPRGFSGSPLFSKKDDGWHISGIVSARQFDGGDRIIAVRPETVLERLVWTGTGRLLYRPPGKPDAENSVAMK